MKHNTSEVSMSALMTIRSKVSSVKGGARVQMRSARPRWRGQLSDKGYRVARGHNRRV
jgi:hypothetical protein